MSEHIANHLPLPPEEELITLFTIDELTNRKSEMTADGVVTAFPLIGKQNQEILGNPLAELDSSLTLMMGALRRAVEKKHAHRALETSGNSPISLMEEIHDDSMARRLTLDGRSANVVAGPDELQDERAVEHGRYHVLLSTAFQTEPPIPVRVIAYREDQAGDEPLLSASEVQFATEDDTWLSVSVVEDRIVHEDEAAYASDYRITVLDQEEHASIAPRPPGLDQDQEETGAATVLKETRFYRVTDEDVGEDALDRSVMLNDGGITTEDKPRQMVYKRANAVSTAADIQVVASAASTIVSRLAAAGYIQFGDSE